MPHPSRIGRRALLASLAAPLLQGCAAPLPPLRAAATTPDAQALLAASAAAHGMQALAGIRDVSVRYAGQWRAVVGTLQPDLVDERFRGGSEERLLLRDRVVAQAYTGPGGHKQVLRRMARGGEGGVRVWFNGEESAGRDKRDAAALVADGYALFLLGPMLVAGAWADDRSLVMEVAGPETIPSGGQDVPCDVLRIRMSPGIGLCPTDELALFIGRDDRLMRRVRFTLNGLDSTRGAVAEVDTWAHVPVAGVCWPTRFHEFLRRPLLLPVHDWRLEGLDVNRGLDPAAVDGVAFTGAAAAPAVPLPG